jgi:hypothetical protein
MPFVEVPARCRNLTPQRLVETYRVLKGPEESPLAFPRRRNRKAKKGLQLTWRGKARAPFRAAYLMVHGRG